MPTLFLIVLLAGGLVYKSDGNPVAADLFVKSHIDHYLDVSTDFVKGMYSQDVDTAKDAHYNE